MNNNPFRWIGPLAAAAIALAAAQAQAQPAASATPRGDAAVVTSNGKLASSDLDFLKKAAHNGHAEVEASKLVETKGSNTQVKSFAQQMVADHTKVGGELDVLAASKGVRVPAEPSMVQKAKARLVQARDGAAFDRAYIETFGVKAHEETVRLFQKAAKEAKDADVKAFAEKTLPGLQQHLKMARDIKLSTDKDKETAKATAS